MTIVFGWSIAFFSFVHIFFPSHIHSFTNVFQNFYFQMEFHVRGNLWFVFFFYIWTFGLEKTWHFEEHLHMNAFKRQFHFQGFPFRASLSVYVSVCEFRFIEFGNV